MTLAAASPATSSLPVRALILSGLIATVWINASEVFRYFVFVMPMVRAELAMVPDVAPMDWGIFAIWGAWDTLLTVMVVVMSWLVAERFGYTVQSALMAGLASWLFLFVLFWGAQFNMNLASPALVLTALPLALLEMLVASGLVVWGLKRFA